MSILSVVTKIEDRMHFSPLIVAVERLYLWLTGPEGDAPPSIEDVSEALADLEADVNEAASVLSETEFARRGAPRLTALLINPSVLEDALTTQTTIGTDTSVPVPTTVISEEPQLEAPSPIDTYTHVTYAQPFGIDPAVVEEAVTDAQEPLQVPAAAQDQVPAGQLSESDLTTEQVADLHAQAEIEARHEAPYAGDSLAEKAADAVSRMPAETVAAIVDEPVYNIEIPGAQRVEGAPEGLAIVGLDTAPPDQADVTVEVQVTKAGGDPYNSI